MDTVLTDLKLKKIIILFGLMSQCEEWLIRLGCGVALHRGSILASHPVATTGSIIGVPKNLMKCCCDLLTALVIGEWPGA